MLQSTNLVGGGTSFIPLPIKLRARNAIVNVQNTDQKCFLWAIFSALHTGRRQHKASRNTYSMSKSWTSVEWNSRCKWRTYLNLKIKVKSWLTSSAMKTFCRKQWCLKKRLLITTCIWYTTVTSTFKVKY